jgi:phosphohistidine phosphatase
MIVYLLRHGLAEDHGVRRDEARRLTDKGRDKLVAAAPAWRRCVGRLDRILTSPLVRAKETAVVFAAAVDHALAIDDVDCLLPLAEPVAAVDVLREDARAGRRAVALVGHEPQLGSLLGLLLCGAGAIPLKKGMLVGVDLPAATARPGRLILCLGARQAARVRAD